MPAASSPRRRPRAPRRGSRSSATARAPTRPAISPPRSAPASEWSRRIGSPRSACSPTPRRSEADILIGPPVAGNGAGGPRIGGFGFVSGDVRTFCAVGDLYCSTPKDDFVTRAAGFLAMASGGDPSAVDRYRAEADAIYLDLMSAGGLPILQSQLTEQANDEREIKIRKFYESQIHQDYTNYAVEPNGTSATTWLRNWLASKV